MVYHGSVRIPDPVHRGHGSTPMLIGFPNLSPPVSPPSLIRGNRRQGTGSTAQHEHWPGAVPDYAEGRGADHDLPQPVLAYRPDGNEGRVLLASQVNDLVDGIPDMHPWEDPVASPAWSSPS
jgi:hypothetical protein